MPEAAQIPFRSVGVLLADELSNAADLIEGPREFERMAGFGARAETSTSERIQLYKALADGRPGWARVLRNR